MPIILDGTTGVTSPIGITTPSAGSFTTISSIGDQTIGNGNLVIGTNGKGIDFSATPGTGTSELLADYEEGTWTPTQGSGLTVIGTFSSFGRYVKIGRTVTFTGSLAGSTSIALDAGSLMTSGLPYSTALPHSVGAATNNNATAGSLFQVSIVTLYTVSAIGATPTIYLSGTYDT